MKNMLILASAFLLPISGFADVRVSVNAHYSNNQYQEYKDEGEPWFEDGYERGPEKMSYEFQWSISGGIHVLRSREIYFNSINSSWSFGPWIVRDGFCHRSCRLNHQHHYYHRHASLYWSRSQLKRHNGAHYSYMYRPRGPHLRPGHTVYKYDYYPKRNRNHGDFDRDRDRDNRSRYHRDRW